MTERTIQQPTETVSLPFPLAKDRKEGHFISGKRVVYFYFKSGIPFFHFGHVHGEPNGSVVVWGDKPFNREALNRDDAHKMVLDPRSPQLLTIEEAREFKGSFKSAVVWLNGHYPRDMALKITRHLKVTDLDAVESRDWKPPVKNTPAPRKIHHTLRG